MIRRLRNYTANIYCAEVDPEAVAPVDELTVEVVTGRVYVGVSVISKSA